MIRLPRNVKNDECVLFYLNLVSNGLKLLIYNVHILLVSIVIVNKYQVLFIISNNVSIVYNILTLPLKFILIINLFDDVTKLNFINKLVKLVLVKLVLLNSKIDEPSVYFNCLYHKVIVIPVFLNWNPGNVI